jgi:hypothetical protein
MLRAPLQLPRPNLLASNQRLLPWLELMTLANPDPLTA